MTLPGCAGSESNALETGGADTDLLDGEDKIVNGATVSQISQYGFAAYVEGCGGTFIHPRWVLSAAHCWRPNYDQLKQVRYGHLNYTQAQRVMSQHTYSRAEYRALSDSAARGKEPYDIVLVELAAPVDLADIALLPNGPSSAGEPVTLAGFGSTESDSSNRLLRAVDLTVSGACVARNKFCAEGRGAARTGDSGGGVYRRSANRHEIVGITSTSDRSGWTSFTEVYAYLDWIKSISGVTRQSQLRGFEEPPPDTGTGTETGTAQCGGSNTVLDLRVHLMREVAMNVQGVRMTTDHISVQDVERTILPGMNLAWAPGGIQFRLEKVIEERVVKGSNYNADLRCVESAVRGSDGRADDARLPCLYRMMRPENMTRGEGPFHLYVFPFTGNTSQGNAMRAYNFHSVLGAFTNKHNGGGPPMRTPLAGFDGIGSVARTAAHEQGHVLDLSHDGCQGGGCLMNGSTGSRLTSQEISTARAKAERRSACR